MNNLKRATFIFLIFCLTSLINPCESFATSHLMPNTLSLDFIMQAKGDVTLIQSDEDYYVTSQNSSCLIFGEEAFTEDNILQHFIFKKSQANQDDMISPVIEDNIYSKAQ